MPALYATETGFVQNCRQDQAVIRAELSAGLLAPQAHASPKYLYDALGSKLFEAICELPEYYPTRTEQAIFERNWFAIAQAVGAGATLIDLGAGNCAKAARLFPVLKPAQYVPVDISVDHLRSALEALQKRFPQIQMSGVGLDFSSAFDLPEAVRREKRLFFYPGSSIGNFTPEQAVDFLRRLRAACDRDGAVLIGIDLVKDEAILDAAYDDALGVTAAFNLNLLRHLNGVLGTDFRVGDWRHCSFYNAAQSRIEMHLEARTELLVSWPQGQRRFAGGERIHTENSYKYTPDGCLALLAEAGFGKARLWTDASKWFAVIHAHAL
jgi:dimethylhistidine N-methyltransferase